jgi:hypothetical protein
MQREFYRKQRGEPQTEKLHESDEPNERAA